jgi:hypothetical protein
VKIREDVLAMDNQLAVVGHVWLAAMIDGEGVITLDRSGKRRQTTGEMGVSPMVMITNTNHAIIETARIYVEELGINPYIKSPQRSNPKWKPEFKLCVKGLTKTPILLGAIRPYVVGKQMQLDLVLEFCKSRIDKGKPKGFAYDQREQEILQQIRVLNQRGVRD